MVALTPWNFFNLFAKKPIDTSKSIGYISPVTDQRDINSTPPPMTTLAKNIGRTLALIAASGMLIAPFMQSNASLVFLITLPLVGIAVALLEFADR